MLGLLLSFKAQSINPSSVTNLMNAMIFKVRKSISTEGSHYFRRIAHGGVPSLALKRVLLNHRTKSRTACLFERPFALSERLPGLTEELLLYGIHEPVASRLYLNALGPEETILDVGSNVGYYAALAASKGMERYAIHCFEPDPELAGILEKNTKAFKAHFSVSEVAVSDAGETLSFFRSKVANWGSIRQSSTLLQSSTISVASTTIDRYCHERGVAPTFIRMDIEGAEVQALRGGRQTLSQYRPKLFIEAHFSFLSTEEVGEMLDVLLSAGYSKAVSVERYYDTPWSTRFAKKRAVCEYPLASGFMYDTSRSDRKVMSLFIS